MPQIFAAIIPFLAANAPAIGAASALATAGTTIGSTIANAVGGGPSTPGAPTTPPPTPPNAQQLAQQRALVGQQVPNVDAATSGTSSPEYQSLMAQILSGVLGQPGATAAGASATGQQPFSVANSQPTNAAVQGQPVNLSDFVNANV